MATQNQPTAVPTNKVTAATLGCALATIAVWGFEALSGVDIPLLVEAAVATVGTFGAGYLVPERA